MIQPFWITEARKIVKQYNVKLKVTSNYKSTGLVACVASFSNRKNLITINKNKASKSKFFSILFHELGHKHCSKNRIWSSYHVNDIDKPGLTKKEWKAFKITAYKAECWVDKWAENEMKKFFPNIKYQHVYLKGDKSSINFIRTYYGF